MDSLSHGSPSSDPERNIVHCPYRWTKVLVPRDLRKRKEVKYLFLSSVLQDHSSSLVCCDPEGFAAFVCGLAPHSSLLTKESNPVKSIGSFLTRRSFVWLGLIR